MRGDENLCLRENWHKLPVPGTTTIIKDAGIMSRTAFHEVGDK